MISYCSAKANNNHALQYKIRVATHGWSKKSSHASSQESCLPGSPYQQATRVTAFQHKDVVELEVELGMFLTDVIKLLKLQIYS